MTSSPKQKSLEILSPAGAGIVVICFFLPWLRVSCGAKKMTLSGLDMGGSLYIVLGSALVMIAAFAILKILGRGHLSRHFLLVGSLLAAGTIIYESIKVALDPQIPFYIPGKMIGFELKAGAYGTILGLILSGAGAFLPGRFGSRQSARIEKEDCAP